MRRLFLFITSLLILFSLLIPPLAYGDWGGDVSTGSTGCDEGQFNTCTDSKASCEQGLDPKSNSTQDMCILDPHPNKDTCSGYTTGDSTHTQQVGICYYSDNDQLPSCNDIISVDYHTIGGRKPGSYHSISDVIHPCGFNWGRKYQCCAPDVQPSPQYPPPPCNSNGKDKSICTSVDTGVGTVQVDPGSIVGSLFGILLGLAGGIALVLIIFSGYQIMFAQADPEKLTAARERLISAIIGLLFIIFSITILQIIGVDILHLPGLNR